MRRKIEVVDVTTGIKEDLSSKRYSKRSKTESKKRQLLHAILYGRSDSMWFSGQNELQKSLVQLLIEFSYGTEKDIRFLIKCLKFANEKKIPSEIIALAIVILSTTTHKFINKNFDKAFDSIVINEEIFFRIIEVVRTKTFRGFGRRIRRNLIRWLSNINEYNAIKLSGTTRQAGTSIKGRMQKSFLIHDVLRLLHPKFSSHRTKSIFTWIVKSETNSSTPQLIKAWIDLSNTSDNKEFSEIIKNNNFCQKALITKFGSAQRVWEPLFQKADFYTILANLNNFHNSGVFENKENITKVVSILTNPETIKNSKLTPFYFLKAHDTFIGGQKLILSALKFALETSYSNLVFTKRAACVVVDTSMIAKSGKIDPAYQVSSAMTLASIAAIFQKSSRDCDVITISNNAERVKLQRKTSTLDASEQILKSSYGSSRNYVNGFKLLLSEKKKYDVLLFLNADVSWRNIIMNTGSDKLLSEYINNFNPNLQMILWQLNNVSPWRISHTLENTSFVDSFTASSIKFVFHKFTGTDYYDKIDKSKFEYGSGSFFI